MNADLFSITVLGELLDDLERVRVANDNRVSAFEREIGVPNVHLSHTAESARTLEQDVRKAITKLYKAHPLYDFTSSVAGAGDLLMPRLIAAIGDPADPEFRPNPGKLLAYCGHGDPHRKRFSGMTQEQALKLGNPTAKKRVWLLSDALVKRQCPACKEQAEAAKLAAKEKREFTRDWNPSGCTCADLGFDYRAVYNEAREKYQTRTHEDACKRCGPSGHPALPGSPWSDAHQHAAALRLVGKRFLIDLWVAAREVHGLPTGKGKRGAGARRRHNSRDRGRLAQVA